MATIKSHTDIGQSRLLAKFLPIESADMSYIGEDNALTVDYLSAKKEFDTTKEVDIFPCWSLAALMKITEIDKSEICFDCYGEKYRLNIHYQTLGSFCQDNELYESKIDALFAMIIKLHKRNLL
jgi:hypothetical protein